MKANIHHKVFEKYPSELSNGCVLLLKNINVFNPSPTHHYLNITLKNINKVYPIC